MHRKKNHSCRVTSYLITMKSDTNMANNICPIDIFKTDIPLSIFKKRTFPVIQDKESPPQKVSLSFKRTNDQLKKPNNTPAATAEPITPATFGPMACMSR